MTRRLTAASCSSENADMDLSMTELGLIVAAYLIGSISSAIIVCLLMGLPDPRSEGSNNPGATNVLRIGGKKAAAITLLGDIFYLVLEIFQYRIKRYQF